MRGDSSGSACFYQDISSTPLHQKGHREHKPDWPILDFHPERPGAWHVLLGPKVTHLVAVHKVDVISVDTHSWPVTTSSHPSEFKLRAHIWERAFKPEQIPELSLLQMPLPTSTPSHDHLRVTAKQKTRLTYIIELSTVPEHEAHVGYYFLWSGIVSWVLLLQPPPDN